MIIVQNKKYIILIILSAVVFALLLNIAEIWKIEETLALKGNAENSLKSLNSGNKQTEKVIYEKLITKPLEKSEVWNQYVSGVIEYWLDGEIVATIDYGIGECDNKAKKTHNGITYEVELINKTKKWKKNHIISFSLYL